MPAAITNADIFIRGNRRLAGVGFGADPGIIGLLSQPESPTGKALPHFGGRP